MIENLIPWLKHPATQQPFGVEEPVDEHAVVTIMSSEQDVQGAIATKTHVVDPVDRRCRVDRIGGPDRVAPETIGGKDLIFMVVEPYAIADHCAARWIYFH